MPALPTIPGLTYRGLIGSGGFADVYLYESANPVRNVAVKVLHDRDLSQQWVRSFADEANTMAALEHPYIVRVYSSGLTDDGRPYIEMAYYPDGSLAQAVAKGPLPVAEVLRLGIQLASAISAAHQVGLLHRDIKPANVLIDRFGDPSLTDFGIASHIHNADQSDSSLSVPWAAPEAIFSNAPLDRRADVYSLAATLWHLLVGHSPFELPGGDNKPTSMMVRVRDLPAPSTGRSDVPESLDLLLRQALAKDPRLRPATADDFARALNAVEEELRLRPTPFKVALQPTPTTPTPPPDQTDLTRVRPPTPAIPQPPPVSTAPAYTRPKTADDTRLRVTTPTKAPKAAAATHAGIGSRTGRYVLAILAVVMGVALSAGAVFLQSSVQSSTKDWTEILLSADVYIKPQGADLGGLIMNSESQFSIDPATTTRISGMPEAGAVYTAYIGRIRLLISDGKPISSGLAPSIGISMAGPVAYSGALSFVGTWPTTATEVVLDKATAERTGLKTNDRVKVVVNGITWTATITGIASYQSSLGGANLVILHTRAAEVFSTSGMAPYVAVRAAPGVPTQSLADLISATLDRGANAQVVLGSTVRAEAVDHSFDWLTLAMLGLAVVSIGIGGFLLASTFSSAQSQRIRKVDTLILLGTGGFILLFLATLGQMASRSLAFEVKLVTGLAICLSGGVLVTILSAMLGTWVLFVMAGTQQRTAKILTTSVRVIPNAVLLLVGCSGLLLGLLQDSWLYIGVGAGGVILAVVVTWWSTRLPSRPALRLKSNGEPK